MFATALVAAGCGSGADNGETDAPPDRPSPGGSEGPPPSLCDVIDAEDVAATYNEERPAETQEVSALLGKLSLDVCNVRFSAEDGDGEAGRAASRTVVTYMWSIDRIDDARWDDILRHYLSDDYTETNEVDLADGGFRRVAYERGIDDLFVRVGDRVVGVSHSTDRPGEELLGEALQLGIAQIDELADPPSEVVLADCEQADAEAASVLGEPPTIRRDSEREEGPGCGWATADTAVTVHGMSYPDAEKYVRTRIEKGYAVEVAGAGVVAAYAEDMKDIQFATPDGVLVFVTMRDAKTVDQEALEALARKVEGLYS
jgi:hypothetical protein